MKKKLLSLCLALAVVAPTANAMNTAVADAQSTSLSVTETDTIDLETAYEEKLSNFEYVNPYYDAYELSYDVTPYEEPKVTTNYNPWGFKFKVDGEEFVVYFGQYHFKVGFLNKDDNKPNATSDDGLSVKITTNEYYGRMTNGANDSYNSSANKIGTYVNYANNDGYYTFTTLSDVISGFFYDKDKFVTTKGAGTLVSTLKKLTLEDGTEEYQYYQDGRYICSMTFEKEVEGVAPYIYENHPTDRCTYQTVTLEDSSVVHDESCTYEYVSNVALTPNVAWAVDDEMAKTMDNGIAMQVGDRMGYNLAFSASNKSGPGYSFTVGEQSFALSMFNENYKIYMGEVGAAFSDDAAANFYAKRLDTTNTYAVVGSGVITDEGAIHTANGKAEVFLLDRVKELESTGKVGTELRQQANASYAWYNAPFDSSLNIIRLENETLTLDDVNATYAMYKFSLINGTTETDILQLGFVVDDENTCATVAPYNMSDARYSTKFSNYTYVSANPENNVKEPEASTDDVEEFLSYTGASVRMALDEEGLRFTTAVDKKLVKAYQEIYGESNVEFGVKLTRDADDAFVYVAADIYKEVDGKYVVQVAITDLNEGNYTATYTPQVYIAYRTGDTATEVHCVIGEALTDNARSIAFVANEALNDTNNDFTEEQITLLKKFAGITE